MIVKTSTIIYACLIFREYPRRLTQRVCVLRCAGVGRSVNYRFTVEFMFQALSSAPKVSLPASGLRLVHAGVVRLNLTVMEAMIETRHIFFLSFHPSAIYPHWFGVLSLTRRRCRRCAPKCLVLNCCTFCVVLKKGSFGSLLNRLAVCDTKGITVSLVGEVKLNTCR